ncbi:hypothetical protein ACPPVU_12535 [Mucilaginibacter sp. McL0603]|uniref:hypothetical protein n=1 Tax=Mucilaginibacter sp. McL0603 TaxID=3415670 RepID=UPI003CF93063
MTNDEIKDYLYFFWAPLLKADAVSEAAIDEFQKMIILTLSQAVVYIEAPAYKAGTSTRDFSDNIITDINEFSDKIFNNIPLRTTDDSYWLKITVSDLLPAAIGFTDTHLEPEVSFGPFKIADNKSIVFDFYYLAHQLLLQLPTTAEISAVISAKTPIVVPDGAVTNMNLADCTIWLSAIHFDSNVADATLYTSIKLKQCDVLFDSGFTKSGNKIAAAPFVFFSGFTITCIPENEIPDGSGFTVAAGNTVTYPDKFVFTFKHRPGLPQPPKITLTHTEPFSSKLFGSTVNSVSASDIKCSWAADKKLLSFPLQTENDSFLATENSSPVFDLKGDGKITNAAWYFPVVSTNHPLAFERLGIASESGYIGFDINEGFSLSWNGLENSAVKLKGFFIRSSPETLLITYTANPSLLAKQQLKLWRGNEQQKRRSVIEMNYAAGGKGNFISHRKNSEQHITNAAINVNIDRPLLSNGDRVFLKTSAELMLFRDGSGITAVIVGSAMDPAIAFENNAFKQLSSFALSNALIRVNPVKVFLVVGKLDASGIAAEGNCIILFPVPGIEHTLPDPYITSLFNDQPLPNGNVLPARGLLATVSWNETDEAELIMQLSDENGNVFIPKGTISDEQLADVLLHFPLPHPGEKIYDEMLQNEIASKGMTADITPDATPYGNYQSVYHSKTNTTGAFSTLHILPGNVSLVDVSGRASQMGVAFSRRLDNTENGIEAVLENTGYHVNQVYRIANNELVSSGRFVRAFTLPHVQWEPVYFEDQNVKPPVFTEENPFPAHGVATRISSANKADVTLAPVAVVNYIVEGFRDEKSKYAAAAHFALPFGMNAVALFHPMVDGVKPPPPPELHKLIIKPKPDPYSYSVLNFNQPDFNLKKEPLSGAIQITAKSEGYLSVPRDNFPDASFHGAVLQMPKRFDFPPVDSRLSQVIAGNQTATALLNEFVITENADFALLHNTVTNKVTKVTQTLITYDEDSILGIPITRQFNTQMWHEQDIETIQVDKVNKKAFLTFKSSRSPNAKVPLRRIDFSGLGASIFSNWLDKTADAGAVSQVKFNILIGRVAHEVIQIKSAIAPFFVPVVRTIIIERKNHGNIIRTDTGWVATGPGRFHFGYDCHPGVIKGVFNVTSIKDTQTSLPQQLENLDDVKMAGVYFDADVLIENVVSGFKDTAELAESNYKLVPSKKQFGYIILGNNAGKKLYKYYTKKDLQTFMTRPDVGALGGPVDCIVNIAGADQMMHVTRVDVTATTSTLLVAAARGTLQLPKGGSWSVVKKITNGATLPLTNDETVPLIRNGQLQFDDSGNPANIDFKNSLHVLGNPLEIEKYAKVKPAPADLEYALLQSTGTQKLLFPRPSFDSNGNSIINGITNGLKQILVTNPVLADPYSLLKSNAIFPDNSGSLSLNTDKVTVDRLDITKDTAGISFPTEVAKALDNFIPPECVVKPVDKKSRKLYLVDEKIFQIYIDYGGVDTPNQLFKVALDAIDDTKRWQMGNTGVAIVVNLGPFQPLITINGNFNAEPGAKPTFDKARIEWGKDPDLQKIIQVLSILYMLSSENGSKDIIASGFSFVMGNSPDSWSYKCTIEEKIPVIKFPNPVQLAQLPGPAPLIVEAGLDLGVFFNLSLSADPGNLIKAGAGVSLGFEATIQVLLITIEAVTAYGVGTAKVEVFIELPDAKPTFKFTMGFGATVAVQLPMVGYVSLTRVISLGVSIDNGTTMTVGQMLRGVLTVGGGLASVSVQVEASGTVSNKGGVTPHTEWTATVRGVFTLDVTVAFVLSWDFSEDFEHEIDLPNPF